MIIRSQDKNKIATFDKCKATESGEVFVNGAFFGNYSTEEKAIKVLDMIENEFQTEIRKHRVFQMPQDSEVSVE
jgi:hypothetical protein